MFGLPQKPWLWTEKNRALALLVLASGPLPNAANSSDVPTKFAAEPKKEIVLDDKFQFVTSVNFSPSTFTV